jgi:hypothetical protein
MRILLAAWMFGFIAAPLMAAQASVPGDNTRPAGASINGVDLAGKVSKDGRALLADDDNTWSVSNADALKGLEGRYVTVKCRMDLNKHAIRVLYVIQPLTKHTANLSDSAFRR